MQHSVIKFNTLGEHEYISTPICKIPQISNFFSNQRGATIYTDFAWLHNIAQSSSKAFIFLYLVNECDAVLAFSAFRLLHKTNRFRILTAKISDALEFGGFSEFSKVSDEVINAHINNIYRISREKNYQTVEIEINSHNLGLLNTFRRSGYFIAHVKCNFFIKIQKDINELLSTIHVKKRNQLKQSLFRGVKVAQVGDINKFISSFYPIYLDAMMRKRLQPESKTFFLELLGGKSGNRFLKLLANVDGKSVATLIVGVDHEQRTAYYNYSAALKEYLPYLPIERLLMYLIQYCQENDITKINLMGTSADISSGVYRFKSQLAQYNSLIVYLRMHPSFFFVIHSRLKNFIYEKYKSYSIRK